MQYSVTIPYMGACKNADIPNRPQQEPKNQSIGAPASALIQGLGAWAVLYLGVYSRWPHLFTWVSVSDDNIVKSVRTRNIRAKAPTSESARVSIPATINSLIHCMIDPSIRRLARGLPQSINEPNIQSTNHSRSQIDRTVNLPVDKSINEINQHPPDRQILESANRSTSQSFNS